MIETETRPAPVALRAKTDHPLSTMCAAAIDRFGGPEVLAIHPLKVPRLGPLEVLIALHTSGVGQWDAEMRSGWVPGGRPRFPLVLGTDGAGTVTAVGSRIRRFKVGDLVYSYSFYNRKGGFYAEYVAVAADKVAHIPKGCDLRHAGSIPTTGLTALQGIDDALGIRSGESILIHGAAGGVGSLAIQFAKLRHARVFATATGDDGVEFVRSLRADGAVDGKREDIALAARNFAPQGMDAVLGLVGDALESCLDTMRSGGRVAYPNGVEPVPKKRHGIRMIPYDAVPGVRQFERLNRAVEAAKLQVPIAAEYTLEEASKAHERLAAGHILGKVVLRVR